jgi:hypothetical protein
MEKPAAIYAEIRERILVPGVTGGTLVIGKPFGKKRARLAATAAGDEEAPLTPEGESLAASAAQVRASTASAGLDEADEAVVRRLRRLVAADAAALGPRIDGAVVELAALLHDAVAAFHPDMAGLFRPKAPKRLLQATVDALVTVHAPATVRGALLRHVWLGDLVQFELMRTEVKWWTGRATFVGRTPPKRLLAWPDVRRVQRRDRTMEILRLPELFADASAADATMNELYARAMTLFLQATPITDLALAARGAPPFQWSNAHASFVANGAAARLAHRAIVLSRDGGKSAFDAIAASAGGVPASLRMHSA